MKRAIKIFILCYIFLLFSGNHVLYAFRQIPDNNLSYPVLILLDNSSGSGFFLKKNDETVYLVTARHVLYNPSKTKLREIPKDLKLPNEIKIKLHYDDNIKMLSYHGLMTELEKNLLLSLSDEEQYRNAINELYEKSKTLTLVSEKCQLLSYPHDINEDSFNLIFLNLKLLNENNAIIFHIDKDISVVEIGYKKNNMTMLNEGVRLVKSSKTGMTSLNLESVRLFDDSMIGNDVFMFGFPTSIAAQSPDLGIERPLIRKGILSGKNPKLKTIIIDCPVQHGNSGSLVIEKEPTGLGNYSFNAIGIAVRYIPVFEKGVVQMSTTKEFVTYSNSGYSIVEPFDFILELINR